MSFDPDREIRPNTKNSPIYGSYAAFNAGCEFKHWPEVDDVDIRKYKQHLRSKVTKSGKTGLSPASINQALATLQSFFKWLTTKRYGLQPNAER